jgi:hypothetical protein
MNRKQDNRVKNICWIVTVFLGVLLTSQCSNQPRPPIVEVSTPVVSDLSTDHTPNELLPGEEVEIWVNVAVADQNAPIIYTWSIERGEIIEGQGTESIIYQAPDTPGDCDVILKVESGDWGTERSTSIIILAPTPTDTPTSSPTATATFTPPPTDTPMPPASTATFPPVPPTPTPEAVVVAVNGLNLRSGPGITYDPPIGYLSSNENLHITGRIANNQWVQVVPISRTNAISGWVRALPEYVKIYVDLNGIPITEVPPTSTTLAVSVAQTPSPLPSYPAPVLAAPDEDADVAGTFPPMYWNWDRELARDEYFEVRVWHTDVPYPIALGWVKEEQFDYNISGERHGKYHWSVIIVKDEYVRTKDWYDPSKWPYSVWEHDPAVEDSSILTMSQESEVRSFFYTPPPGVGTGGPGLLSPTCETNPDLCD